MRAGVLALQGGFGAHLAALSASGWEVREVRTPGALLGLDALVLPGGESTTQLLLLDRGGLREPLERFRASGRPVLATCAGLIVVARGVHQPAQDSLGWLDVDVERNAYGRQLDSFEARDDDDLRTLVFIRAPRITRVGPGVDVLARFRGEPVVVRQRNVVGATFHPELTDRATYGPLLQPAPLQG